MPRKAKKTSPTEEKQVDHGVYWLPNDAAWGGFINIRLDDQQKQTFFAWFADAGQSIHTLLDDVLIEGMKVAFSYDRENQCYIVTFTGALVSNSNERYCATSRAGTLIECLGLSVWKHFYLADGDYGSFKPKTGQMNNWG